MTEEDLNDWEEAARDAESKIGRFWFSVIFGLIAEVRKLRHDLDDAVGYKLSVSQEIPGDRARV